MRLPWTQEDVSDLGHLRKVFTVAECAVRLGRSVRSVENKLAKLGIRNRTYSTWTIEDMAWLVDNRPHLPISDCAAFLGKTPAAVRCMASRHRIVVRPKTAKAPAAPPAPATKVDSFEVEPWRPSSKPSEAA